MKKIINEFPDLTKYPISKALDNYDRSQIVIDAFKEMLPMHLCLGTVDGRDENCPKIKQTKLLRSKCSALKKLIFSTEFYGCVTIVANGTAIICEVYFDEDWKQKDLRFTETEVVNFDFTFNEKQ